MGYGDSDWRPRPMANAGRPGLARDTATPSQPRRPPGGPAHTPAYPRAKSAYTRAPSLAHTSPTRAMATTLDVLGFVTMALHSRGFGAPHSRPGQRQPSLVAPRASLTTPHTHDFTHITSLLDTSFLWDAARERPDGDPTGFACGKSFPLSSSLPAQL